MNLLNTYKSEINKLAVLLISVFIFSISVPAKSLDVGSGKTFKTIKKAIQFSVDGDTIFVYPGHYKENKIRIAKKLVLLGIDNPVVDGEGKYEIFLVNSDNVKISGFTITNAGLSFINDNAGVKLDSVKNCVVSGNKFLNNFFAIYLSRSSGCTVINNYIKANSTRETTSGNGIHLWYCKNIDIKDNQISGMRDGIYFEFVMNANISGNLSKNNLRYGMHFMFSDSCKYWDNTFENNGAGVAVMYSKYVEMYSNNFQNNWGSSSYGILLKDISDSNIYSNKFIKNTTGIFIEGCNRIIISKNNFSGNGWGIKLMSNSMDNEFTLNNFVSNSFDVATNSRQNFNTFKNNYWSSYKGYDLDKDGIGDVPFHPVKLSSLMVQQQPASLILLRSLFVEVLDTAESIIPALTPKTLIDEKPMMRQIN